jgi:hypothetical protein
MWPVIRTALQRPQIIVVLALLFLVIDAGLAILSPVSAANDPERLHPASFPGTQTLLEAPRDCRVTALDATTGVNRWNATCPPKTPAPSAR